MIRSLNTGVQGVRQFQTSLDAIGNNLANINTVAYKSARIDFADTLNQTLRAPTPDGANSSGRTGMQVGNGLQITAIKNSFTQGAIKQTGVRTDVAVSGEGFFLVKDSVTKELFATRAGDFRVDMNNYLVTNGGHRVQGLADFTNASATNALADKWEEGKMKMDDIRLDTGQYTTDRTGLTISAHDRIYKVDHGYTTGKQVKFKIPADSTPLPLLASGEIKETTAYYVNKVDKDYFTLHTTAAEAATASSAIDFKNATTGITIAGSSVPLVSVSVISETTNNTSPVVTTGGHNIGSSTAITKNGHGYVNGQPIRFNNAAAAPTPAALDTTYYVGSVAANTFNLFTTKSASGILSGPITFTVTTAANFSMDTGKTITRVGHGYNTGASVKIDGTPPEGLDATINYYVNKTDADNFTLHLTVANAVANSNSLSFSEAKTFSLKSGYELDKASHGLTAGAVVRFGAAAAGPGGSANNTYHVGNVTAGTFTLHSTATDATSDANPQSFSSGGAFTLDEGATLTKNGHGLTTGEKVNFTGTAPGNTTLTGTYYVNVTDTDKFTIHSSKADAESSPPTNPIVFNTTGTYSVDGDLDGGGHKLVGGGSISSFSIGGDGKVNMLLTDGTAYVRGQLRMQNFSNKQNLMKAGNNLYTNLSSAGAMDTEELGTPTAQQILDLSRAPGSSGMGAIESGALELSNVDMAKEFANMITTQRAFQANARVITTSDEILQEMMQLKR